MFVLNLFSAIALIFEGYNQGVLGTVSTTPGFINMAGIGADGIVTNSTKQGGLAASYYFGAMWGCFIGGEFRVSINGELSLMGKKTKTSGWVGDKLGRRKGVWLGAAWCMAGAALMSGSVHSDMFICARIMAGIGMGFINAIVPPWVSELSQAHDRGFNFSLVFVANYVGIVIAYWINFGVRTSPVTFQWRFPLGFMAAPMLIVILTVFLLPESPRWLMANHRREEAIEILARIRGDLPFDDPKRVAEVEQLDAIIEPSSPQAKQLYQSRLGRSILW